MSLPRIAVTMGDPAGVGPEICLQALKHAAAVNESHVPFVPIVFGDVGVLRRCAKRLSLPFEYPVYSRNDISSLTKSGPAIVGLTDLGEDDFKPGTVSAATGAASYTYIEAAIEAAKANDVAAITTAPIHKEALQQAGVDHPGHTEILAEKTQADRYCMMLTSEDITCSLVTTHVGLCEVAGLLKTDRILEVIELSAAAMQQVRRRKPRLTVCGLNPHAGEGGLFGRREEELILQPAIDAAREKGVDILGPLPPDTAFLPNRRSDTDCYICMYHDQGLIPLKTLAFESAVNVTLGLPIIRTSVDHGTALDIAWQGKADSTSMMTALRFAAALASDA